MSEAGRQRTKGLILNKPSLIGGKRPIEELHGQGLMGKDRVTDTHFIRASRTLYRGTLPIAPIPASLPAIAVFLSAHRALLSAKEKVTLECSANKPSSMASFCKRLTG